MLDYNLEKSNGETLNSYSRIDAMKKQNITERDLRIHSYINFKADNFLLNHIVTRGWIYNLKYSIYIIKF